MTTKTPKTTDYGAALDQLANLRARFVTPFEVVDEILAAAQTAQSEAASLRADVTRLRGEVAKLQGERDALTREARDAFTERQKEREALEALRGEIANEKDKAERAHAKRVEEMAADFAARLAKANRDHHDKVAALAHALDVTERRATEQREKLDAEIAAKTAHRDQLDQERAAMLKRLGV